MPRVQSNQLQLRSFCPVNYALEIFGDKWSLLIVRDIIYKGKRTHGEFLKSSEGIATNILADRLARLECQEIIFKEADPSDKRREIFSLTDKGLALIPLLLDMNMWSDSYGPEFIGGRSGLLKAALKRDREGVIAKITEDVKRGGCIFDHTEWIPPQSLKLAA